MALVALDEGVASKATGEPAAAPVTLKSAAGAWSGVIAITRGPSSTPIDGPTTGGVCVRSTGLIVLPFGLTRPSLTKSLRPSGVIAIPHACPAPALLTSTGAPAVRPAMFTGTTKPSSACVVPSVPFQVLTQAVAPS